MLVSYMYMYVFVFSLFSDSGCCSLSTWLPTREPTIDVIVISEMFMAISGIPLVEGIFSMSWSISTLHVHLIWRKGTEALSHNNKTYIVSLHMYLLWFLFTIHTDMVSIIIIYGLNSYLSFSSWLSADDLNNNYIYRQLEEQFTL